MKAGLFLHSQTKAMDRNFVQVKGQGWMSHQAMKVAYGCTPSELRALQQKLKPLGACCPRKGFAIDVVDQALPQIRGEL